MTPEQLNGWVMVAAALLRLGMDAGATIAGIFRADGRSEDELNQVLAAMKDEALMRRAVSASIAFGA